MVSGDRDEKVLIEGAQRDPRRFAELYALHFDRVYAFIARRVPARPDVQDLTAEVFHHALATLGRFEWRGVPFAAWLYRIAANAIADHYRRRAREQEAAVDADLSAGDSREIERRVVIHRAIRTLPADQRRVIELRFAGERSIAEIAQAMGRSEGAVKQLQLRAIQGLRQRLDQNDA